MSIADIANDYAALCKAGQSDAAGEKYWSADVVSIEAGAADGADPVARGIDAVRAKGEWWYGAHEVHSFAADGPYINGDQFIMRYSIDVTQRETGQRIQMQEEALYTVADGKVVEERFFY
ncbi:MAG: nuclear transport factor 2 family protein [Sphingopyxis sp.]|jgi:hypothetical protein|nr:nuclear transport factor 2 family protein [Sphingopyxis sp.]